MSCDKIIRKSKSNEKESDSFYLGEYSTLPFILLSKVPAFLTINDGGDQDNTCHSSTCWMM